ncbi:hypothetical protein LCGC14_1435230 [marine sediment metagenome]|uniref:Uncharacterized protein n=1 Tax=marine sediment metagenome TaxID=412755 RepID=A0A0F9MP83_9ZZZZ
MLPLRTDVVSYKNADASSSWSSSGSSNAWMRRIGAACLIALWRPEWMPPATASRTPRAISARVISFVTARTVSARPPPKTATKKQQQNTSTPVSTSLQVVGAIFRPVADRARSMFQIRVHERTNEPAGGSDCVKRKKKDAIFFTRSIVRRYTAALHCIALRCVAPFYSSGDHSNSAFSFTSMTVDWPGHSPARAKRAPKGRTRLWATTNTHTHTHTLLLGVVRVRVLRHQQRFDDITEAWQSHRA